MLDTLFYLRQNKNIVSVGSVLERLYTIFSANNYGIDYEKFFDALPSTQHKLKESCSEATEAALYYLLIGGKNQFFYYQFCIDEIFANYPGTMSDVSRQFKSSKNERYNLLAEKVENASQEATKAYNIGCQIQDLAPSYNHLCIYQHAQNELLRQSGERKGSSFLDSLFPKCVLKYGAKIAFIL